MWIDLTGRLAVKGVSKPDEGPRPVNRATHSFFTVLGDFDPNMSCSTGQKDHRKRKHTYANAP